MSDHAAAGDRDALGGAHVMAVLVTANQESRTLACTLGGLRDAFPGAALWVADDGSTDATAEIAAAGGARVVRCERRLGKGGAATRGARSLLADLCPRLSEGIVVLCDGDLGRSAARLAELVKPVATGEADIATAAFARRLGGGFGLLVAFARRSVSRGGGPALRAPLSGQKALRASVLAELLPFAAGYGMEVGMAIDAARGGLRMAEVEIDLEHRATGRTPRGFAHRARQLLDVARAGAQRR